jgi:hypothetical protein
MLLFWLVYYVVPLCFICRIVTIQFPVYAENNAVCCFCDIWCVVKLQRSNCVTDFNKTACRAFVGNEILSIGFGVRFVWVPLESVGPKLTFTYFILWRIVRDFGATVIVGCFAHFLGLPCTFNYGCLSKRPKWTVETPCMILEAFRIRHRSWYCLPFVNLST